jgi:hypothetical protein
MIYSATPGTTRAEQAPRSSTRVLGPSPAPRPPAAPQTGERRAVFFYLGRKTPSSVATRSRMSRHEGQRRRGRAPQNDDSSTHAYPARRLLWSAPIVASSGSAVGRSNGRCTSTCRAQAAGGGRLTCRPIRAGGHASRALAG